MKVIQHDLHYELKPETQQELETLRAKYPEHWPFSSICIAEPLKVRTLKARSIQTT